MFEFIFLVVIMMIGFMFVSTVVAGFRTRSMVNKVFSLAEQEIDRKLHETVQSASASQPELNCCEHCGGKVATIETQCPNCGAGLRS